MTTRKEYIGDGVYVEHNEWGQLVLTTEDGIQVTNRIYLEPEVYGALLRFVESEQARLNATEQEK